jgi:hypothetical protein
MPILDDGFATLISFAENPTVKFKEKSVTPPGLDAGGAIDTTTMRNTAYRTQAPKSLKTLTETSCTVAYDPEVYPEIEAMLGVNQQITITWPDGSSRSFWGWLDKFTPGEHSEGEQPTAEISILPSNQDADGAETAPTLTT